MGAGQNRYADRIKGIFASEESMQKTWAIYHGATPFDRTAHWNTLLRKELDLTWEAYGPVVHARTTEA